ncbi:MAG: hypothetical protein U5K00_20175 [Melioribacteraceae bacterium]|nr:hypothetical protein [Melioribacteraceae bacterium]
MQKIRSFIIILLVLLTSSTFFGQIKIKELPTYDITNIDSLFFDINEVRNVIPLNVGWLAYSPGAENKKVKVTIPSTFDGRDNLVYEKEIYFSSTQIQQKEYSLEFLGINYSADILLNDMVIYKHPGGVHPFSVELPSDILIHDFDNVITVNISFELDDVSTIPVLQRFLFPSDGGGIFRDVYLRETNKIFISDFDIDYTLSDDLKSASVKVSSKIIDHLTNSFPDSIETEMSLNCTISNNNFREVHSTRLENLDKRKIKEAAISFAVQNPKLWSPDNAESYRLELEVILNDSTIDHSSHQISFYRAEISDEKLLFNNSNFRIKGTTYFYSENESGGLISYSTILKDLSLIKETGFNTIRFSKRLPHPFTLFAMEHFGLLAMVEVPLNSIPEQILSDNDFITRVNNQLNLIVNSYSKYSSLFAFGLGGGYIGTNDEEFSFLLNRAENLNTITEKLIYASFLNLPDTPIGAIDIYGIELFSVTEEQLNDLTQIFQTNELVEFISEATYPSFNGDSNGYLNKNSYEAAAKFHRDIIEFTAKTELQGFVLNSFYDFYGDFNSFYSGFNKNYKYAVGLTPDSKSLDKITYKVVKTNLTDGNKITIPIGTEKDDSPILFVVIGLVLSIFMALLINSKRKFREDAGRALIRPYNFFADIRDHRLLSGFQTNILMFVLAGSVALLTINILHFLRTNILLEKILLAFGSPKLIDAIIYLAWHPLNGFIILFIASIIVFLLICFLFKVFSFFLKNKVFFSSIYYSVIWALLPLALLLPLELVLYRILIADVINLYVYIFIVIFLLWLIQRMVKGIYVIFDVRSITVHFYSFLFTLLVLGGVLLYFQITNSTFYHITRAIQEYKFF